MVDIAPEKIIIIQEALMTDDKKLQLYNQQKETLDTFLKTGAISHDQYEVSLNGLRTKMGVTFDKVEKCGGASDE